MANAGLFFSILMQRLTPNLLSRKVAQGLAPEFIISQSSAKVQRYAEADAELFFSILMQRHLKVEDKITENCKAKICIRRKIKRR